MNEATAIEIDSSFFAELDQTEPTMDPRMIRWGYNPNLRSIMIPPLETGLRDPFIPIGKFIPHQTFKTPRENCTLDEYKEKEFFVDVLAAEVETSFERRLGRNENGDDWGYRTFGYGEKNAVKMAAVNQVLIPTLQEIRSMFGNAAPIAPDCKGEDEMDLGNDRTHCASCHLDWIKSDACRLLIQDAVDNGRTLPVKGPDGKIVEITVEFTLEEIEEIRAAVQAGMEIYKRQAHKNWSTLLNELENGLRDKIQDAEHFLRKDLHQPRPQNKDAALIEKVIDAQNRPQADNAGAFEHLARGQAMLAESLVRTNEVLAQMARNQGQTQVTENPAAAAPEKAAKSKNKGVETEQ